MLAAALARGSRGGAVRRTVPRALSPLLPRSLPAVQGIAILRGGGAASGQRGVWHYLDWAHFRRLLLTLRAAFLAGSLYSAGYAAGVSYSARDPLGTRREQLYAVIKAIGATDAEGRPRLSPTNSPEVVSVREVLPRILHAARAELASMRAALEHELEKGSGYVEDIKAELKSLETAATQLENWTDDGFLVLEDESPNAFVHPLVPRVVFVQRGLFWRTALRELPGEVKVGSKLGLLVPGNKWDLVEVLRVVSRGEVTVKLSDGSLLSCAANDLREVVKEDGVVQTKEQLGMLLGHELSHVIHSHDDDRSLMNAQRAGFQLVLLVFLDPTGLLSFVADACTSLLGQYMVYMPASRQHELEADATGLRIAARAGYDPAVAPSLFKRMAELEEQVAKATGAVPSWASTHPRSEDRVAALEGAVEEARVLYDAALAERDFWRPVGLSHGGGLSRFIRRS